MSIRAAGQSQQACSHFVVVLLAALSLLAVVGCDTRQQKPKVSRADAASVYVSVKQTPVDAAQPATA